MNKASVIGLLTLMSISSFAMAAYTGQIGRAHV